LIYPEFYLILVIGDDEIGVAVVGDIYEAVPVWVAEGHCY
jgi:hypothetical protein